MITEKYVLNCTTVQMGDLKQHISPERGIYNIIRDPAERFGDQMGEYLWAMEPFRRLLRGHQEMMRKFPNRPPGDTIPPVPGLYPGK